jgi:hypothetical protein
MAHNRKATRTRGNNNTKTHSAGSKSGNAKRPSLQLKGANPRRPKQTQEDLSRLGKVLSKGFVEVEELVNIGLAEPLNPEFSRRYYDPEDDRAKAAFLDSWSCSLEQDLVACGFPYEFGNPCQQIADRGRAALEAACAFVEAMNDWMMITRLALLFRSRFALKDSETTSG